MPPHGASSDRSKLLAGAAWTLPSGMGSGSVRRCNRIDTLEILNRPSPNAALRRVVLVRSMFSRVLRSLFPTGRTRAPGPPAAVVIPCNSRFPGGSPHTVEVSSTQSKYVRLRRGPLQGHMATPAVNASPSPRTAARRQLRELAAPGRRIHADCGQLASPWPLARTGREPQAGHEHRDLLTVNIFTLVRNALGRVSTITPPSPTMLASSLD